MTSRTSKRTGVTAVVLVVLGFLIAHTTLFRVYSGWVGYNAVAHASPSTMSGWCGSSAGQYGQTQVDSISSACSNAGGWNFFGNALLWAGIAMAVVLAVRFFRALPRFAAKHWR